MGSSSPELVDGLGLRSRCLRKQKGQGGALDQKQGWTQNLSKSVP